MAKLLFANCTLTKLDGSLIPFGHRVHEGTFPAERVLQLLAIGAVIEKDPLEELEPAPKVPAVEDRGAEQPWSVDPKSIANDNLDTLNMKIQDRAKRFNITVEPFTNAEEARAFLSIDFVPAAK